MLLLLQYHHISPIITFNPGTVQKRIFQNHLKELRKHRFTNLEELDSLCSPKVLERKVLITFDDGYKSVFEHAYPIMNKYGFKGVVFVVTKYIGKISEWEVPLLSSLPHLGREEIKTLHKSGWIIGSHSHGHKDLTTLSAQKLKEEIKTSIETLEDILGNRVYTFSYPFGKFNQKVKDVLVELGIKFAFKSSGKLKFPLDLLEIPRRSIYLTDFSISLKIDTFYNFIEYPKETISNKFAYLSPIYLKLLKTFKGNPCD
ncbi:MAG: polysaccharide deacetylase family protein [bacterium]|nr:polysaccharide deacetylase family protein [bacterium]